MATTEYTRPIPTPDEASRPFFDGALREELMILRCAACGHRMWGASHSGSLPVQPRCHECFAPDLEWVPASGRATLYSFAVMHQPYPGFEDAVPYNIALVELEEGVRCLSNVVGCANDELRVGMSLEVVFDRVSDEVALPRFRAA